VLVRFFGPHARASLHFPISFSPSPGFLFQPSSGTEASVIPVVACVWFSIQLPPCIIHFATAQSFHFYRSKSQLSCRRFLRRSAARHFSSRAHALFFLAHPVEAPATCLWRYSPVCTSVCAGDPVMCGRCHPFCCLNPRSRAQCRGPLEFLGLWFLP
jgi:hypothetical protein